VIFPKNIASAPSGNCRVRQGWLKNVTRRKPEPSVMRSSVRALPRPRPGTDVDDTTRPKIQVSSSSCASRMEDCFVLSR
jgi:hypothetical protein